MLKKAEILTITAAMLAAAILGLLIMGIARGEVPSTSDIEYKTCNGVTTAWTFSFGVWDTNEVKVVLKDANDLTVALVENSDYTVTLPNGDGWLSPGGTVTTGTAYATGNLLIVSRNPRMTQESDYDNADVLDLAGLEDDLDQAAVRDRYLLRLIRRALRTPESDQTDMNLPAAKDRAGTTMTYDANGKPLLVAGVISPNDVNVTAFWDAVLDEPNMPNSVVAMGLRGLAGAVAMQQSAEADAAWWTPVGDGVADDRTALQSAISYAVANHRGLLIPDPAVAYRITGKLLVGTEAAVTRGLVIRGIGNPQILWDGDPNGTMIELLGLQDSRIENLYIDGNNVAGVTGIQVRADVNCPSQKVSLADSLVANCPLRGIRLTQDANATCDYITLDSMGWAANGVNLYVEGDVRQVEIRGGASVTAGTYALEIAAGHVSGYDTCFARSGTADIHLASNLAVLSIYGATSESNEVLVTTGTADEYSPLTPPILLIGFNQDPYVAPFPGETAIDFNAFKSLVLIGCKFVGDVNIGQAALNCISINTEWAPPAFTGVTGSFTGETWKVGRIGVGIDGYPNLYVNALQAVYSPPYPLGIGVVSVPKDYVSLIAKNNGEPNALDPNTSYYRRGDAVFHSFPSAGDPLGWAVTTSGSEDGNTPATFHAMAPLGWLTGSVTWNPASLADGVGETSGAITVPGAAVGDYVLVAPPYDLQDCVATGYVQDVNTVEIRLQNESGGTKDLASGTWRVRLIKP